MEKRHEEDWMNIKIKTLSNDTYEYSIARNSSVISLKKHIQNSLKIPLNHQRLIFKGKLLLDSELLSAYKVTDGQVIHLVANTQQSSSSHSQSSRVNPSQSSRIERFRAQNSYYRTHRYLQRRMNGFRINHPESLEVLEQNKATLDQLIDSLKKSGDEGPEPFDFQQRKFTVGMWVDVRDSEGQWYEGQILQVGDDYVLVQYCGLGESWNEWISAGSDRILPFRSNTVQSAYSLYMSPFPQNTPSLSRHLNFQSNINEFIVSLDKTLEKVVNLLRESQDQSPAYTDQNQTIKEQPILEAPPQEREQKLLERELAQYSKQEQEGKQPFDKETSLETPYRQTHQISLNDNLSNKCDDNLSNKCENDDMSNKSYKSKRSEGLVDTSSMKSLKIEEKKDHSVFFDLQAKSVRSMKSELHKGSISHYYNPSFQQNILEQEDSQIQEQDSIEDIKSYRFGASMRKQMMRQEKARREQERIMKASQLAPLLDRMGRLLIDLAPHVALMGSTEQIHSYQNLSVASNEGSLQSRIVNYLRTRNSQLQTPPTDTHQPSYCDFQVPIMLTPIQIYALNEIQSQNGVPTNGSLPQHMSPAPSHQANAELD